MEPTWSGSHTQWVRLVCSEMDSLLPESQLCGFLPHVTSGCSLHVSPICLSKRRRAAGEQQLEMGAWLMVTCKRFLFQLPTAFQRGASLPLLDKRVLIALGTCGESHGRGSELYLWKEQGENVPPIRWTLNFWLLLWCSRMCSPLPEGGFCSIWATNHSEELPATDQWSKSICALPHWLYSNANQMKPACARH